MGCTISERLLGTAEWLSHLPNFPDMELRQTEELLFQTLSHYKPETLITTNHACIFFSKHVFVNSFT